MAQEQHGAPAAKWRPPPLDNYSSAESEGTGDDLTPSDDSDDEGEDDSGNFSGNAAAGSADEPAAKPTIAPNEQVVVGAGALRGEQEAYSMRDVQSMKVPRLRAMCEARGLKKNGTKQQLINRLLASTADSLDAIPGWTDRKSSPTPTRLNPQLSGSLGVVGSPPNSDSDSGFEGELDSVEQGSGVWDAPARDSGRRQWTGEGVEVEDDNYRPTGAALQAIINAPRLRRRAGVTFEFADSKITKYEKDRSHITGSRIRGLPAPRDTKGVEFEQPSKDKAGVPNPTASTLNGIPREFLPPSLRAFDPNAQNKRRGPGRPRAVEDDDGIMANEWAMVKSGGGMSDQVQESPFDAMIRKDIEEEERLNPKLSLIHI